jgi:type II secretory pathway pseudopilin PulG
MMSEAIERAGRRDRGPVARRGYTLVEAFVVLVVMCVLISMGLPQFQLSLEKARADVAGANLRSIWSAQRLYWLENRIYAPDLPTLQSANLIDPSLPTTTAPYAYSMTVAPDGSTFTATATRSGPTSWSGSFSIAADGTFTGSIQQSGHGVTITPDFQ